jgi:plasmid stabilization system protein ParE
MKYNLVILEQAQQEIELAFEYYQQFSIASLISFNNQLEDVYKILETNPMFQFRYQKLRGVPLKSLPYLVFFSVDEVKKTVYIYSVFNTFQNTIKYPKL